MGQTSGYRQSPSTLASQTSDLSEADGVRAYGAIARSFPSHEQFSISQSALTPLREALQGSTISFESLELEVLQPTSVLDEETAAAL
eukprot:8432663-Pyramimonas_sp.AAC.1